MKILIVHLSDIHLKDSGNFILKNKEKISSAFRNETLEVDHLFLLISGDIAFSGRSLEYNQAMELIDSIKKDIWTYSKKQLNVILVPGNHDCDYNIKNKVVREVLVKDIQQNWNNYSTKIDDGIIELCCEVQQNVFEFMEFYQGKDNILFANKLLWIIEHKSNGFDIIFSCYNTAWISQIHEEAGKMYFPLQCYPKEYLNHKSNLAISILHHPFNWQNPGNWRELKNHLEKTSDIVLTGHEHVASKSGKDDFEGNYTIYIEGAELQGAEDGNSGFNVIVIDLENEKHKISSYKLDGGIYKLDTTSNWLPYKRYRDLTKIDFEINKKFQEFLNDPGASFTHPNKTLVLEDFFVYPDLRDLKIDETEDKNIIVDIVNSTILCQINESKNRILLIGSEKSGRTSLCKVLYKHYYKSSYVPVYIDGHKIKSASIDEFKKLINHCFCEQYGDDTLEKFQQLENGKKLLIVDDFHNSRLNTKHKSILLRNINQFYPNIIIIGNDLFQFEEIVYEEKEEDSIFQDYQQFQILEFGHLLRSKLIRKWNTIGLIENIEEDELTRKDDKAKQIINTIIGRNFVPSYPIFLLTILQTIEAGYPHDFKQSSYGYYYQFLITRSLNKIIKSKEEIDAYYNYITELAYHFFKNRIREVSKNNFTTFHNWYCEEYRVRLNFDELTKNLIDASMIEERNEVFKFKYNYMYYFGVAKYLSDNITDDDIKLIISCMWEMSLK